MTSWDLLQRFGDVLAITTRSRSMLSGNGLRIGRRRWSERTARVLIAAFSAASFLFGCCCFQLFELKLHLLQQPRFALRAAAYSARRSFSISSLK